MRKFYLEVSELVHDDENCTSWTELQCVVVMYADDSDACYEVAKRTYRGFEVGYPTEEEPACD